MTELIEILDRIERRLDSIETTIVWTVDEACKATGVPQCAIRREIKAGRLSVMGDERNLRFRKIDFDDLFRPRMSRAAEIAERLNNRQMRASA